MEAETNVSLTCAGFRFPGGEALASELTPEQEKELRRCASWVECLLNQDCSGFVDTGYALMMHQVTVSRRVVIGCALPSLA